MATLYLVRHGQASLGAQDYDQLSELGHRQSVRLGQYWRERGITFDAVFTGTLRRHAQTWAGIAEGAGYDTTLPVTQTPGLNEYDSAAVIAAIHPQPLPAPTSLAATPELYRQHFRLLRDGLAQWMNGVVSPQGMPSYEAFRSGVAEVLTQIRQYHAGEARRVLLVSSGGPIATAVGQVLGTTPEATIELNMRIRNSALTEFVFTPKRHTLLSYNTLPHLDHPDHAHWVTYA